MIKSVYDKQEDILNAIIKLHCPDGFECDLTYGNGNFYKNIPRPKLCFDIEPSFDYVEKRDSCNTGLERGSLNSIMFDPPFLTYVKNGKKHKDGKVAMTSRFGGYYTYKELWQHYLGTINESFRILKKGGHLVFKCQDIIHNHKMHCTHAKIIDFAEGDGGWFRLKDLFVLAAKHRMPGPQKGTQRHARIFHSYFLVFEKL
jgi:hypothetical protein